MIKTNEVTSQGNSINKTSNFYRTSNDQAYKGCVIANDAAKKLDFLILVIETLQINATDTLLRKAKNIGLPNEFSSRVELWKIRCSNPMRKSYTFESLSSEQIDSLVELISCMADSLYPLIRQLLSSKEPEKLNQERWILFSSRLKSLIRERMNIQRTYILLLLNEDNYQLFRELLVILSLSCGPGGANRLKSSLYYQT